MAHLPKRQLDRDVPSKSVIEAAEHDAETAGAKLLANFIAPILSPTTGELGVVAVPPTSATTPTLPSMEAEMDYRQYRPPLAGSVACRIQSFPEPTGRRPDYRSV